MHIVSGKIFKAPFIKPGCGPQQDSTMYAVELSEMIKDFRDPNVKHYANYKAMFFAKTQAANEYYSKAFAEGSFVVIACEKLKVETREHNGQTYVTLMMENAKLEGANFTDSGNAGWGQPQQAAPQNPPANQNNDFDEDSIPF